MPLITILRVCIARCVRKATNTHSEYVILIAFPLLQFLHERTSVLRYAFVACLVDTRSVDVLSVFRQVLCAVHYCTQITQCTQYRRVVCVQALRNFTKKMQKQPQNFRRQKSDMKAISRRWRIRKYQAPLYDVQSPGRAGCLDLYTLVISITEGVALYLGNLLSVFGCWGSGCGVAAPVNR